MNPCEKCEHHMSKTGSCFIGLNGYTCPRVMHGKTVLVIESVGEYTEYGLSFNGHNPEDKDYFIMDSGETAIRLQKYLEKLI